MSAPIQPKHYAQMNAIAHTLDEIFNGMEGEKRYGFCLLVFEFGTPGPGSRMNYISNAKREDMVVALREFLANHEGRMMPEAKGQ